jgi:hypothetical protein
MQDWKETLKIQKAKTELITDDSFTVGRIVYMPLKESDGLTTTKGYESRRKYFVIVGFTAQGDAVGVLLINSKPNDDTEELGDCQFPVYPVDYDFLNEKSWLDCSFIAEPIDKDRIKREGVNKGCLTEKDLELVMEFIVNTDVITPKTKRKFGII